jgi:hypothetical protein
MWFRRLAMIGMIIITIIWWHGLSDIELNFNLERPEQFAVNVVSVVDFVLNLVVDIYMSCPCCSRFCCPSSNGNSSTRKSATTDRSSPEATQTTARAEDDDAAEGPLKVNNAQSSGPEQNVDSEEMELSA